ncbi:hypothetical protein IV73_GL000104 [Weissella kandleri]|uniref:Uncharacterized protein n=1 Tax=Weissella kandleri TaxID=1616 RepID=A0A0R2JE82_9LACO|nr:hypothetical protein [Weissella kandleri]KRN75617.1 hypothetical protein IV73_GL000104 [Weissella kandleri]
MSLKDKLTTEVNSWKQIINSTRAASQHFQSAKTNLIDQLPLAEQTTQDIQQSIQQTIDKNQFRLDHLQDTVQHLKDSTQK